MHGLLVKDTYLVAQDPLQLNNAINVFNESKHY